MTDRKKRLFRVLMWAGLILGIGLAYAFFVRLTGWAVPCLFHTVTGLWCPGCGVSRMCLALLRGDFSAAFRANPGLAAILPAILGLLTFRLIRYVDTGRAGGVKWEERAWIVLGIGMGIFGILRNLPQFSCLAPG